MESHGPDSKQVLGHFEERSTCLTEEQAINQRIATVESENRRLRRELVEAEDKLQAISNIERSSGRYPPAEIALADIYLKSVEQVIVLRFEARRLRQSDPDGGLVAQLPTLHAGRQASHWPV